MLASKITCSYSFIEIFYFFIRGTFKLCCNRFVFYIVRVVNMCGRSTTLTVPVSCGTLLELQHFNCNGQNKDTYTVGTQCCSLFCNDFVLMKTFLTA